MIIPVVLILVAVLVPLFMQAAAYAQHRHFPHAHPVGNNVGVSNDDQAKAANFDWVGYSYSEQALEDAGITPGKTIQFNKHTFQWPNAAPGMRNNFVAHGQTLYVTLPKGATNLALLGSASFGPSMGVMTITYSDETMQSETLGFSDWTLNRGDAPLSFGNKIAITTAYRNHSQRGKQIKKTYVFESEITLQPGKTVKSITLPRVISHGQIHVFALGVTQMTPVAPTPTLAPKPTPTPTSAAKPTPTTTANPTPTPTKAPGATPTPPTATPTPVPTQPPAANLTAWSAFDGGGQRTGVNTTETTITTNNVGQLTRQWQQALPATADGTVAELPNVMTAGGSKTLLFATTKAGSLVAVDAANGNQVWRKDTSGPNYTTSSPAIDPNGKFVYSYGLDGKVHKYAVGDGAEVNDNTWPAQITVMPNDEKGSSSINIGNGYLYMSSAGYPGDGGHYEGHIVAVNLASSNKTVWNSLCANINHILGPNDCPDVQSAIWGRGAPTIDPVTGNVFVTTGNGPYRGDGRAFGDSIVELNADLTRVIDSYTPANFQALQNNDADLGSAVPALLPKQANSKTPNLLVQAGKDNNLRLINRDNLSGQGGPNHVGGELQTIPLAIGGDVDTHPAVWNDANGTTWVFVTNFSGLMAYKVVTDGQGKTTLQMAYQNGASGSSPFVANGILYIQGDGVLHALNPTNGTEFWNSRQASAAGSIGGLHWESPIVVNGHIYVPDNNGKLTAYGLK